MKTEFTPEEEARINETFEKHIAFQTTPVRDEDIINTVKMFWTEMSKPEPEIFIFDTPKECKKACREHGHDVNSFHTYWGMWLASYAATYEFAETIGVEFNEHNLKLFNAWSDNCSFVLFNDEKVYVSRKLTQLHFNDAGQLHNTEGPSAAFGSDEKGNLWGVYHINGVLLTEQIVMRPETQSIEDITSEDNEEVKRIRIERYGWSKFLKGINARVIDERVNDIEGTRECLVEASYDTSRGVENIKALICACPSTAKEFILEVNPSVKTCREAQAYLSSGLSERIISAS